MRTSKQKFYKSKEGMALIVTLLILMVLSVMAVTFSTTMSIEAKLANNYRYELETELLTRSALEYAAEILRYDLLEDMAAANNLFDDFSECWWTGFDGTDVDLNDDGNSDSKWIYMDSPWGNREGLLGRFAIYINDEASKINLNVAGYNLNAARQGWSTYEVDMTEIWGIGSAISRRINEFRFGTGNLPGLSATDDNYSNDILMNDFMDNDGDNSIDEANEGIDEPGEYIFESPQDNDTRWTTMEQIAQCVSGVGQDDIDDWRNYATLWSWDHDISNYRDPGSGNWWRENWLPKTNLNHLTSWHDMYRPFMNPEETSDSSATSTISNWQQKFVNAVDYFDTDCIPTEVVLGGIKYFGCEGLVINEVFTNPHQMIKFGEFGENPALWDVKYSPAAGVNGWLGDSSFGFVTDNGKLAFHEHERDSTGVLRDWSFNPDIRRPGYYEVKVKYKGWYDESGTPGDDTDDKIGKFTLLLTNSAGTKSEILEVPAGPFGDEDANNDQFQWWNSPSAVSNPGVWWFDGGGNDIITFRYVTDPLSNGIRIENMELDQRGHTNYVEVWNCSKQDIPVNGLKLMVKWWDGAGYQSKDQDLDHATTMMGPGGVIASNEHVVFAARRNPIGGTWAAGFNFVSFVTCHGNGDITWGNDAEEQYDVFQMEDPGDNTEWHRNHLRGEVWIQEESSPNITLASCFYDLQDSDEIVTDGDDRLEDDNPHPEYSANCAQECKSPFAPREQEHFGSFDWIHRWKERYGFTAAAGIFASPGKANNDTSFTNTEPYKTINNYAVLDEPAVSAGMLRNMYLAETTYNSTFSDLDLKNIAHRFTNNCIVIAAEQCSSHTGANWAWDAAADPNGNGCFKSGTNGRTNWAGGHDTFTYTNGVKGVYVPDGYYDLVLYGKYKNDDDKVEDPNYDEVNSFRMDFYDYDPATDTYADSGSSNTIYYILPNHSAWKTTWDGATSYPYRFDRFEEAPYCINGGSFQFKLAAWWRNAFGGAPGVPDNENYFDYLVLIPRAVNNSVPAGNTMPLTGRVPGRININTASGVALQALPGINAAEATQIIGNTPYQKIGDVIDGTVITPEIFEKIANLITVRSDIFEVIIQAERIIDKNKDSNFDPGDKVVAKKKIRAIVDRSTTPVTVILMKEEEI